MDHTNKYFFEDKGRVLFLQHEASSWIGTPFRPFSKKKGLFGGIDCIGLAEEIMLACGAAPRFNFPRSQSDYQGMGAGEKFLDYMRGKIWRDPQSAILRHRFDEIRLPLDIQSKTPPREFFMPGDLLVLRRGSLFHMPIVTDYERHFVSAIPRAGVIDGTIQDHSYRSHLVAMFRARAL